MLAHYAVVADPARVAADFTDREHRFRAIVSTEFRRS